MARRDEWNDGEDADLPGWAWWLLGVLLRPVRRRRRRHRPAAERESRDAGHDPDVPRRAPDAVNRDSGSRAVR